MTACLLASGDRPAGAGPTTAAVARAFFEALASGNAERFEAMARERFAPAHAGEAHAAERAEMFERMRGDFGTMTLGGVRERQRRTLALTVQRVDGDRPAGSS